MSTDPKQILTLAGCVSLSDVSDGLRVIASAEDIIEAGDTRGDGVKMMRDIIVIMGSSDIDVSGGHRHRMDGGGVNDGGGDGEDGGRG